MGCLSAASRMHGSPNEGVVYLFTSSPLCGPARELSLGHLSASHPFTALTLWNSLAASR